MISSNVQGAVPQIQPQAQTQTIIQAPLSKDVEDLTQLVKDFEIKKYLMNLKPIEDFASCNKIIPDFYKKIMEYFGIIKNLKFKKHILKDIEKQTINFVNNGQTTVCRHKLVEILFKLEYYLGISQYENLKLARQWMGRDFAKDFVYCTCISKPGKSIHTHSLIPLSRTCTGKQTIELKEKTVLIHQTSLENAIKILTKKIIIANEQRSEGYLGRYVYFGVGHLIDSYVPQLNDDERSVVLENRYGSVSFKFTASDVNYGKCYNLGERKFKYEHSHLYLLAPPGKLFGTLYSVDQDKELNIHKLEESVPKWELKVSGKNFTNAEVCIEGSFNLPTEFTIQVVPHYRKDSLCVTTKRGKRCGDCLNDKKTKKEILNTIKTHFRINEMYTITESGDFTLEFKQKVSTDSDEELSISNKKIKTE